MDDQALVATNQLIAQLIADDEALESTDQLITQQIALADAAKDSAQIRGDPQPSNCQS